MEKETGSYRVSDINLAAGYGAKQIIQRIGTSSLQDKLILRKDSILRKEWYEKNLLNHLEFFVWEENVADTVEMLEELFSLEEEEREQEEIEEVRVLLCKKQETRWEEGDENPRIRLKVAKWPFQIIFELEIIPYLGKSDSLEERILKEEVSESEEVIYYMFTLEEYLARSFYKIIDHLELIKSLSWYQDIYDIITNEVVEGRKVSQSFEQLILDHPIPALEDRLAIIQDYETYEYMNKRWKRQNKRWKTSCPQWGEITRLLVRFFKPMIEEIQKDEVFVGDWMPQLARYLD
ncbi:MAG: hypothetical protein HFH41_13585 [Lachnospiraceae bacterium]|nr:hypothetical protein [Lachnospiraceae bacterium]